MSSSGLDSFDGVERFASLLYGGDKSALQIATDLGWGGMAATMGVNLVRRVLQESLSAHSIFFVSQALHHLVDSQFNTVDLVSLESFLSWVIVQRHKVLGSLSVDALIRLLCATVRRGFCEATELQSFPLKVSAALMMEGDKCSEEHISLSCSILIFLIDEMESTENAARDVISYKRVGICFRDECLLPLFRSALHCFKRLRRVDGRTIYTVVTLIKKILLFDFTCSCDEATEDVMTYEFPSEWASDLVDMDFLSQLWELYAAQTGDAKLFCAILETLTSLVSLKSSCYASRQQREEWLTSILSATLSIMESRSHLEEVTVLREFCRLLNRIKPNFTIDEMRKVSCYEEWVQAAAAFTKLCFQNWRHARQVFLSLTSMWAKLVGAQSYCRDGCTLFEVYAPDVCLSYMMSNQEQAVRFANTGETASFEDYILDADTETLSLELEFASQLLRFCGEKTEDYIIGEISSLFYLLKTFQDQSSSQLTCICERLSCIITLASSWLRSYRFSRNARVLDSMVLLMCLDVVKQSCQLSVSRLIPLVTSRHLHKSLLMFLRSAWHLLLLDRLDEAKKLRESLQESFLLKNSDALGPILLGIVVDEVLDCVHFHSDDVTFEALQLLSEMAQSPSTAVILKTLPQLKNHGLVSNVRRMEVSKHEAVFYRVCYILSRIEAQVYFLGCTLEVSWSEFVQPLFEELNTCLKEGNSSDNVPSVSFIIAICSWRGIFHSCVGQNEYKMLLKRFSPCLFHLTQQLKGQLGSVCCVQLLRLIKEVTENRYRRINFGVNGVEGYHIFRCVGGSMGTIVEMVITALESGDLHLEEWGIKCLRILLQTGHNILTGGYCSLGVLRLYEDKSLMICLTALWRSLLLVDNTRLCHYEKLAASYLLLAGDILRDLHLWFLCRVSSVEFIHIVHTLEFSLRYYLLNSVSLASLSAEALGAFSTMLCCAESEDILHRDCVRGFLLQADPGVFLRLLRLTLDLIMSKKCSSSVAEVLLRSLIALDAESFEQLAGVFAGFAVASGRDVEVREAFALLGSSACESVRKNNNNLFAKKFQQFSNIVTSCLC